MGQTSFPDDAVALDVRGYLEHHLPAYPFDPDVDAAFVDELLADFPDLDLLEQLKRFRWYYNNRPLENIRNARGAIRGWLRHARRP
jgi:hypothetical protein